VKSWIEGVLKVTIFVELTGHEHVTLPEQSRYRTVLRIGDLHIEICGEGAFDGFRRQIAEALDLTVPEDASELVYTQNATVAAVA